MHRRWARFTAIALVAVLSTIAYLAPVVASPGRTGLGYWEAQADGGVYPVGDAAEHGGVSHLGAPITGIAAFPGGQGYALVAADGGVFTFGRAKFYGSLGGTRLTQRVVGIAYTRSGRGYYLVAADGGIFTFGDAKFRGSAGALLLRSPIVGMALTPTGIGYWLVAADGGIFTFGDALFRGSAAPLALDAPIVGIAADRDGRGYWLAGRGGAVYAFGNAPFLGSPTGQDSLQFGQFTPRPIAAIVASPSGVGYLVMSEHGDVAAFGDANRCIHSVNNRDRESGSFKDNNVGVAIAFDRATAGSPAGGSCGDLSHEIRLRPPLRIEVTQAAAPPSYGPGAICGVSLVPSGPVGTKDNGYIQLQTPGRVEVRAAQLAGHKSFRIEASPNCLAIVRPGAGGVQSLPFTTSKGGDTLPFSSASPVNVDSVGKRFNSTTRQICRIQVYRNSDGRLVYEHQAAQSHTLLPAGAYFLRSEEYGCPVTVR